MAIEIRELVIRAVVDPQTSGAGGPPARGSKPPAGQSQAEMVAECVEQVLDVLRLSKER